MKEKRIIITLMITATILGLFYYIWILPFEIMVDLIIILGYAVVVGVVVLFALWFADMVYKGIFGME